MTKMNDLLVKLVDTKNLKYLSLGSVSSRLVEQRVSLIVSVTSICDEGASYEKKTK